MVQSKAPHLANEHRYWNQGASVVAGVDEVGKGAWAGPLTIGAVVLPREGSVEGIRDSKMLTPSKRQQLSAQIRSWAQDWAVGHASARECDELGMSEAQRVATRRALNRLKSLPDRVLLDGKWNYIDWLPSTAIIKGDQESLSIAAASIIAKVERDRLMASAAEDFPAYIFQNNKGYPAPQHRMALSGYGPCVIHRKSWSFMDDLLWTGIRRTNRNEIDQEKLFVT